MFTAPSGPITAISAVGKAKFASPRMCLRRHHAVGAAVGLAGDHGELRHRRLAEGVEQLGPVLDDAAVLLRRAGQEARHVLERHERDVEAVAEADEARALERRVDVEAPGQVRGLVRHDPDRPAAEPPEADDEVRRVLGLDLEEVPVVEHRLDDVLDVVGLVRLLGDQPSGAPRPPGPADRRRRERAGPRVVLGEEGEQLADQGQALLLALRGEVRDARNVARA